jgi:mRNA interferase MazF
MSQVRRGDIALVAGGVYASKPRPAVVLQDDVFDGTDSLTVYSLTTTMAEAPLLRMAVTADESTGTAGDSVVMIDKLTTVRCASVGEVVGRLDAVQMLELERRLVVFLGLAHWPEVNLTWANLTGAILPSATPADWPDSSPRGTDRPTVTARSRTGTQVEDPCARQHRSSWPGCSAPASS